MERGWLHLFQYRKWLHCGRPLTDRRSSGRRICRSTEGYRAECWCQWLGASQSYHQPSIPWSNYPSVFSVVPAIFFVTRLASRLYIGFYNMNERIYINGKNSWTKIFQIFSWYKTQGFHKIHGDDTWSWCYFLKYFTKTRFSRQNCQCDKKFLTLTNQRVLFNINFNKNMCIYYLDFLINIPLYFWKVKSNFKLL